MSHLFRPLRVLHIEDDENESHLVRSELRKVSSRLQLLRVSKENDFTTALKTQSWDLVLFNFHSKCLPAREGLRQVKNLYGDLPFILISGPIGEENVAFLMKKGADDFILKSNYSRLEALVKRVLMDRATHRRASRAQRKAFEAFAARESMLAIVSHDIKNPLSAIHLEAQMLMRTVDKYGKSVMGEEVKIQAGRILKTAERMKGLIIDLLEKNKSQDALKNLQKISVDPVQLFYESLDNVRPLFQEKNIKVKFSPRNEIPKVKLDRNKIYQVFSNLLSNAIKFTPTGGEILFDIAWNEESFSFTVTDSGRGLPIGEEEKVFDKYWTGMRAAGSGTGLGLFICKSIIEAHGGRISCENVKGRGASFTCSLPREKEELLNHIPDGEVFVVDDDEDLCEVMTWALKREGIKVRSFGSGEDALKAISRSRPSVLVVDYHLGDMDGCEFLKRRSFISRECPVILVSGSPDEVRTFAPEGEYVSIIEKPLDLEGLLREVKSLSGPYLQKSLNEASTHIFHGPASAG